MRKIKDFVIKWAVKQIVKDGEGTYAQMRYLEDVIENQFGELQFIFAHRLVRPNSKKRNRPSNDERFADMRSPEAITNSDGSKLAESTDAKVEESNHGNV